MSLLLSTTASGAIRSGLTSRSWSARSRARILRSISSSDTSSPPCPKLLVTAHGPHLRVGRHEEFQLRIGKDHRTDVAPVHDDALVLSHPLLQRHEFPAHFRNAADRTDGRTDLDTAYLLLDALAVDVDIARLPAGIEPEGNRYLPRASPRAAPGREHRSVSLRVRCRKASRHGTWPPVSMNM